MGAGGTYPALQVAFAWGVDADTVPAGGDWVDESDYVLAWSSKVGSEDEFSQPGAGTLTLLLDGSSGRFDPDHTSGALYGDLKPLTWVRVMAGTTTANADVFYGQVSIDGFKLNASQFEGAIEVDVNALDALEQLANTDLPGSVYEIEVKADSPVAWYRLGESSGSVAADSSGNDQHGTYQNGLTFDTRSGLIANDSNSAIEFADGSDRVDFGGASHVTAFPYSFEAWFSLPTMVADTVYTIYTQLGFAAGGQIDTTSMTVYNGIAYFSVSNTSGAVTSVSTSGTVDDEQIHHIVGVATNATDLKLYLDGVDVTTAYSQTGTPTVGTWPACIGNQPLGFSDAPFIGTLDEVAIYDSALSGARVLAHYNAGTNPWGDELTSARVTHLLDAVNFPSTLRSIETGNTTMPAATLAGGDALSALQETATAEGGKVYVDHYDDGKLRFEDRHERLTAARSTTSQATFGDGGGSEVPYSSVELQDDVIINSVSANRFGGSTITVEDATSQATYKERDYSLSGLLTTSDAEVENRAEGLVAEKKDRHRRVRSMVLEPRGDSHPAWAQVFARRIGDRITVKWRPPYGGTYTYTAWIIGIAHDWDQRAAAWRTSFWLEPVPFDTTGDPYWRWDTSTWETGTSVARWSW